MSVDLRKEPLPYRVRHFGCYANGGQRVSLRAPKPRDAHLIRNRADRRAVGQITQRRAVRRSPRMRHGIDDNPRTSVMVRRLIRAAVKATSP